MKFTIIITCDDMPRCVAEMQYTNEMPGKRVRIYRREIEIPDQPDGWCLNSVDIEEPEVSHVS